MALQLLTSLQVALDPSPVLLTADQQTLTPARGPSSPSGLVTHQLEL